MKITKNDLQTMYYEHIEAEKKRLAKLFEEERQSIIKGVLDENKLGKKHYSKRCNDYNEEYFQALVTHLQELFIDSRITLALADNEIQKKSILLTIDWS
jgi:hypothetical protein